MNYKLIYVLGCDDAGEKDGSEYWINPASIRYVEEIVPKVDDTTTRKHYEIHMGHNDCLVVIDLPQSLMLLD